MAVTVFESTPLPAHVSERLVKGQYRPHHKFMGFAAADTGVNTVIEAARPGSRIVLLGLWVQGPVTSTHILTTDAAGMGTVFGGGQQLPVSPYGWLALETNKNLGVMVNSSAAANGSIIFVYCIVPAA